MGKFEPNRFHWFLVTSAALIAAAVVISGLLLARVLEHHVIAQEERHTAQVVRAQSAMHLTPPDFGPLDSPEEGSSFEAFLQVLPGVFRVKVFDRSGTIVWSNESKLIGRRFPDNRNLAKALRGEVAMVLEAPKRQEHVYERARGHVAEAYVPITLSGRPEVLGVVETYTDVSEVVREIHRAQRLMWGGAGGMGFLLYVALVLVVWNSRASELRAVRQLEAQKRLAALGQLAAGVAHDLRNPLSVITGKIGLLKLQMAEQELQGTPLVSQLVSVEDAAKRMTRIVESLSTYSKPPRPDHTLLNIRELLAVTGDLLTRQAQESRVTIAVNASECLPPVLGDRSQLMQVLLNLATNAIEAMAGTGGALTLTAQVQEGLNRAGSAAHLLSVEVSDTGPGISPEILPKIWEAFHTTKPEGTGLGLSIVRSLVSKQPGAAIGVKSQPGQGTTFTLTMPVADGAKEREPGQQQASVGALGSTGGDGESLVPMRA
jgi:signal transduction histidine kinase